MKVNVKAKPNAREEKVKEVEPGVFEVSVKEPPLQGRANAAIAKALAEHFGVSKSQVVLASGFSSKQKVFEIFQ